MKKNSIKAIFFDNDGVLVSTENFFFKANNHVLKNLFTHKKLQQTHDDFAYYCMGASGGSRKFLVDNGFNTEEIQKFRTHRNRYFLEQISQKNTCKDNVFETVKVLHKKFRLSVVTNSSSQHFQGVHQSTQLLPYFEYVITRDDVKQPKPHPEPYLIALKKTKITAKEAIVIEDSPRGIEAAKAAGIYTIAIKDPFNRTADVSAADIELNDIKELPHFLEII